MYRKEEFIIALGTGGLNLGAIVPGMLENTHKVIFIFTSSNDYEHVKEVVLTNHPNLSYSVYYANNDIKNLECLIAEMVQNNVRVAIINVKHPIYEELVRDNDIHTWFTACRDGIFFYLSDLLQTCHIKKTIISFDNDSDIASKAQAMCKDSKIDVVKAVAHCVCEKLGLDESKSKLLVTTESSCELVFPPDAKYFKNELTKNSHFLERRARFYFTCSSKEFSYWILTKKIDVNALHTLVCSLAYVNGYLNSIDITTISEMPIQNLLEYDSTFELLKEVHRLLFVKYLEDSCELYGDDYELHFFRMEQFIKHLFTSERVQRGLDITKHNLCVSKMKDHFSLLKSAGNVQVIHMLESFENIYTEYSQRDL